MKTLDVSHPMIVTDTFLAKCGMADQIQSILTAVSIDSVVIGGAEPNPTDKKRGGWRCILPGKRL